MAIMHNWETSSEQNSSVKAGQVHNINFRRDSLWFWVIESI